MYVVKRTSKNLPLPYTVVGGWQADRKTNRSLTEGGFMFFCLLHYVSYCELYQTGLIKKARSRAQISFSFELLRYVIETLINHSLFKNKLFTYKDLLT